MGKLEEAVKHVDSKVHGLQLVCLLVAQIHDSECCLVAMPFIDGVVLSRLRVARYPQIVIIAHTIFLLPQIFVSNLRIFSR
jgi:hypothetical protein